MHPRSIPYLAQFYNYSSVHLEPFVFLIMRIIAILSTLVAGAFAQGVNIGSPGVGSTIDTGNLTVQVRRPVSRTIGSNVT